MNLNDDDDEETRRYIASNLLKQYVDNYFPDSNVIILGDLNDELIDGPNDNVFQMILDDSGNYLFTDMEIAQGNSTEWSYPSWPSHLDHILITNELFDNNSYVEVIRIDDFMEGGFSQYDQNISDHRPVALKLVAEVGSQIGDINNDGILNIIDIVSIVNIILYNQYIDLADLNLDGDVDILDVIQLVDIILE
jgi:hypothetical protein